VGAGLRRYDVEFVDAARPTRHVIPTQVGTHASSGVRNDGVDKLRLAARSITTSADHKSRLAWVPAFAGMTANFQLLCCACGEAACGGGRQRTLVDVVERNDLIHDVEQFCENLALVVTVAVASSNPGRADVALVLLGPLDDLRVPVGVFHGSPQSPDLRRCFVLIVIPTQVGTHASLGACNAGVVKLRLAARSITTSADHKLRLAWVPACAGMTVRTVEVLPARWPESL